MSECCLRCGSSDFYLFKSGAGAPRRKCRPCSRRSHASWWATANKRHHNLVEKSGRQRRRVKMLALYGGKCACCWEPTLAFLTFDHIRNDGNAHRRAIGTSHLAEWLWKQPRHPVEGIQVLCFNCNLAKGKNGGICPHESLRSLCEAS